MTKQHRGFMVFRFLQDAERYCDSNSETDAKAVRKLFDAGKAAYVTEAATFPIIEHFDGKPYVKIDCDDLPYQGYISARLADRMRWKFAPETEYRAQDWIDAAFFAWAKDDLARVEFLFQRAANSGDATPVQIAKALLLRASVVEALDRPEEALNLLDEIIKRFSNASDPDVRVYAAEAMCDKGGLFDRNVKAAEALAVYEEAISRFGEDVNNKVRAEIAVAFVQKGVAFCESGQFEEAVRINQKLLTWSYELDAPQAQKQRALGYRNLAAALYRLNRLDEALDAATDLIAAFVASTSPQVAEQVSWSMNFRGDLLRRLSRDEEASASDRELIGRFEGSTDPNVQRFVELASKRARG